MSSLPPQLWIIAGPNGAGKSTLVARHLRTRLPIINPDTIALEIGGNSTTPAIIDAGKIAIRRRMEKLSARLPFAIETTLSGNSEIRLMRDARSSGYKVNLVFVGVKSAIVCQWRVAHRVRMGHHHVPPEDILRRFDRSLANLPVAMRIAHRTLVADNTGRRLRLILVRQDDRTRLVARVLPDWALQAIPEELR